MTSYNREKYIAQAIESVLASTYKDFELIIVDDCSKDNTVGIAKKYEELDSRVKVYVNEFNLDKKFSVENYGYIYSRFFVHAIDKEESSVFFHT